MNKELKLTELPLSVKDLTAGYSGRSVVRKVSIEVDHGSLLGVIGPNGAGKSTLFKAILGLIKPFDGEVKIFGDVRKKMFRDVVGYMPQVESVDWSFPVTVNDVVLMGTYRGFGFLEKARMEVQDAVEFALGMLKIEDLRGVLVNELSLGQRRRVLFARALVKKPKLLLLDEPMAGLDLSTQHQVLELLHNLTVHEGVAVVMSTHDLSCISTACDRICCLSNEVVAIGTPREVLNEENLKAVFGQHLLMIHVDGKAYTHLHDPHADDLSLQVK